MEEYKSLIIDQDKKKVNLAEIGRAAKQKKIRQYPSFARNMLVQLRYRPAAVWAAEGICLGAAFFLSMGVRRMTGPQIFTACAVFLVLAGNLGLAGLGRLFSRNMAELEQTLYFNLKQMTAIQMVFGGVLDMLVFLVFVLILGPDGTERTAEFVLYLLVPFVWADAWALRVFTEIRGNSPGFRQMGIVLISVTAASAPLFVPDLYRQMFLPFWGGALAVGAVVLGLAVRRIFSVIEGREELCLN